MEKRKIDEDITTLADFHHSTENESQSLQIYVETRDEGLMEITEVLKVLPKSKELKPYIILRVR